MRKYLFLECQQIFRMRKRSSCSFRMVQKHSEFYQACHVARQHRIQTMLYIPQYLIHLSNCISHNIWFIFRIRKFYDLKKSVNYLKQQMATHLHIQISHQSNQKWFIGLETQWIYQFHYHISFFPFTILFCFSFLQLTDRYKKKRVHIWHIPTGSLVKNNFKNAWIFYKWPNVSCSQIC